MNRLLRLLALLAVLAPAKAIPQDKQVIILASTTSTDHSGLFDYILPIFTQRTGIEVRVVAVGTGQALRIARNGDADVLLVHHRPSEDEFVQQGYGIDRHDVMFNHFVIIGPSSDPANINNAYSTIDAMSRIAATQSKFASRGDNSGTHLRELELWKLAGIEPNGKWYLEIGSGMGATLNFASAANTYTMSDHGTWSSFQNRGELELLFTGDPPLMNPYGIILVNPERFPHVNIDAARTFSEWLTSPAGQQVIGEFVIDGELAFCPQSPPKSIEQSQEYQQTCNSYPAEG